MHRSKSTGKLESSQEKTDDALGRFGSGTILLVEDEEMARRMIRKMLEEIGYTVLEAERGVDAISLIEDRNNTIDLLISDVVMPGMSSTRLRDHYVDIRPEGKILSISGYTASTIDRHNIIRDGLPFLQKPFSKNELSQKIYEVMSHK